MELFWVLEETVVIKYVVGRAWLPLFIMSQKQKFRNELNLHLQNS